MLHIDKKIEELKNNMRYYHIDDYNWIQIRKTILEYALDAAYDTKILEEASSQCCLYDSD